MSYTKVNNAIAAAVHDEKLDVIKQLKVFLGSKMDDVDDINELIDEFSSTLTTTKMKANKKSSSDKPKRTRKPSFYNYWLGNRLRAFGEEQALLPKDDRVPKKDRMSHVTVEWKELKADMDAFNDAKAKWEEMSSSDEAFTAPKKEEMKPAKEKKEKKEQKKKKEKKVVKEPETSNDSDSDSDDEDNSPVPINSDSEDENDE
jgi:hypothetical protein